METQKTQNGQNKIEKEDRAGGIMFPDFRLYYKAIVLKTVWYLHTNRSMELNRELRNTRTHYGQLIYDKGGKNIQWRKDSLFNKWCSENWTATCKRIKLEHSLMPYTKINSKWIKDVNVRRDVIKIQRKTQAEHSLT